jgi:hypothetical protein
MQGIVHSSILRRILHIDLDIIRTENQHVQFIAWHYYLFLIFNTTQCSEMIFCIQEINLTNELFPSNSINARNDHVRILLTAIQNEQWVRYFSFSLSIYFYILSSVLRYNLDTCI